VIEVINYLHRQNQASDEVVLWQRMGFLLERFLMSINAAVGLNSNGLKQKLFTCASNNCFFVLFSLSIGINTVRTSVYEKYSSVYFCFNSG